MRHSLPIAALMIACFALSNAKADRVECVSFSTGQVTATGRIVSLQGIAGVASNASQDAQAGFLPCVGFPLSVPLPGDVTGNGVVNVDDLIGVILGWGVCPAPPLACPADVAPHPAGDGVVDVDDLVAVILNWG